MATIVDRKPNDTLQKLHFAILVPPMMNRAIPILLFCCGLLRLEAQPIRVLGISQPTDDQAHVSFYGEANRWFSRLTLDGQIQYDSTTSWDSLNIATLRKYTVVVFFNGRPEKESQRAAFQKYMESGGGWLGFHFAGFALTPSDFPQNWDWYHEQFLGSGSYVSNTWRPTSARLKNEAPDHPVMKGLPNVFTSTPNEWYRWQHDLRNRPNIRILCSIDASSFPIGTGPKATEIWHEGYYPVVWTNQRYRMVYFNLGHNDMDYQAHPAKTLSRTFGERDIDQLVLQSLRWVAKH